MAVSNHACTCLVLLVGILFSASLADPGLLSSKWTEKTSYVLGQEWNYVVFDAQYDEPLHVIDNYPCPCSGLADCAVPTLNKTVDESQVNLTSLGYNTWLPDSFNGSGSKSYKIDLQLDPLKPCPILVVQVDIELGFVDTYVANEYIPSNSEQQWTKPHWGRDSLWICPTLNWFGYGAWYITVANRIGDHTNRYKIRYYTYQSATCTAAPAYPEPEPAADPVSGKREWQWLSDGMPKNATIQQGTYDFYRYAVNGTCAKFAVAVRRSEVGNVDVDVYVSTTNTKPTADNYADDDFGWNGNMDGDDTVVLSYCQDAAPIIFYIGVTTYTAISPYTVVATHTSHFETRALHELGANQYQWQLARGFDLDCETEVMQCHFGGYSECYGDGYRCCWPLYPIPPTASPNPQWPRSSYEPTLLEIFRPMKWGEYPARVPGKFSFTLAVSSRDSNMYQTWTAIRNWNQCRLKYRHLIVDESMNALTDKVSFTRQEPDCNRTAFAEINNDLYATMDNMYTTSSQEELTLDHLKLSFLAMEDAWLGCRAFVDTLTVASTAAIDYHDSTNCQHLWNTDAYYSDPCCNIAIRDNLCCLPQNFTIEIPQPDAIDANAIDSQCQESECTRKIVSDYIRLQSSTLGCSSSFSAVAGVDVTNDKLSFIRTCRESILSTDLLGRPCSTNSDCLAGSVCSALTKRCNHTDDQVVQCFADTIDPTVGTFLFRQWGLSMAFTPSDFVAQAKTRLFTNLCVGGDAIRYRINYFYQSITSFCEDECTTQRLEPHCLDTSCSIPDICNQAIAGVCWRFWGLQQADDAGCTNARYCNWLDCRKEGIYDLAECELQCGNFTSSNACVRCDDLYSCSEVAGNFDQNRCNQGLCTADASETNPIDCANKGTCDVLCAGGTTCTLKSACELAGMCSDDAIVGQFMRDNSLTGGVCIMPLEFVDGTFSCAETLGAAPNGCMDASIAQLNCTSAGGYWHVLATNPTECAAFGSGCHDFDNFFSAKPKASCDTCGANWDSYYTWNTGVWTPGTMVPLQWVARGWTPINTLQSTIDYPAFSDSVRMAIATAVSVNYITEAFCRYDNLITTIGTVACDCSIDDGQSCFASTPLKTQLAVFRTCPGVSSASAAEPVSVQTAADAVTGTLECALIRLSLSSVEQYATTQASLTSEIYKPRVSSRYAIVRNSRDAIVGQVVSDGVEATFTNSLGVISKLPMRFCLHTRPEIPIEAEYSTIGFGMLNSDNMVIYSTPKVVERVGQAFCANISEPGTYFAVILIPDYSSVLPYDNAQRVQSVIGAAIYYFVVSFAIIQAILIVWYDKRKRVRRLVFIGVVLTYNLIRAVYLTLDPTELDDQPIARYIVFEIPTFLFFSLYTIVLYLWLEIILRVRSFRSKKGSNGPLITLIITNIVLYAIFILFIVLFSVLGITNSPCEFGNFQAQENLSANQFALSISYQIIIAIICLVMAVVFSVLGIKLIRLMRNHKSLSGATNSVASKRRMFTFVAALCTGAFLIRSIIFIISAAAGAAIPVIIFVALEVAPSFAFLVSLKPWRSTKLVSTGSTTLRTTPSS